MNVMVTADAVHLGVAAMAVGVEVNSAVGMAMGVKVYPVPPKTKFELPRFRERLRIRASGG